MSDDSDQDEDVCPECGEDWLDCECDEEISDED